MSKEEFDKNVKLGEEEAVKEQSWRSQTTCRGRQGKV